MKDNSCSIKELIRITVLWVVFFGGGSIFAQTDDSVSDCNDNTFAWTKDPNTIEYDNIVSGYHSTIVKESDGAVKVWGQRTSATGSDRLSPLEVTPANGYNYKGEILKVTLASTNGSTIQFAVLTTEGLYVWGRSNILISSALKSASTFNKVDNGLPSGVSPTDVKMLFGSYLTLGIVTFKGEAWILSSIGGKNGRGDNSKNNALWTRVQTARNTNLTNVIAMRGTRNAMMALTSDGEVYTWGTGTYLGDHSEPNNRGYATKMTLPKVTPKMIGMTYSSRGNSYYLLGTNGTLYSLGTNDLRQLGDFSVTARSEWVRVKSDHATDMSCIAWFSPNEHDGSGNAAVSALTTDGKLWSWGSNAGEMIGGGPDTGGRNPMFMGRGLDEDDKLTAVETGGHTTMVVREGSKKYGYLGHKVNGSMGDGSTSDKKVSNFYFPIQPK